MCLNQKNRFRVIVRYFYELGEIIFLIKSVQLLESLYYICFMTSINSVEQVIINNLDKYLPNVSVDCVIFGFHENQLRVLLVRWENTEQWSLPGGTIFKTESLDTAAYRILKERTKLEQVFLKQFYIFGDPQRVRIEDYQNTFARLNISFETAKILLDRTLSVGYYALVEFSKVTPTPNFMAAECRWWDINEVPHLIFDHNFIVLTALQALRRELNYLPIGLNLLPEKFTMPELQKLYETLLGEQLDRRNFQKQMMGYDFIERLDERKTGGAYKSPYLYRFIKEKYEKAEIKF